MRTGMLDRRSVLSAALAAVITRGAGAQGLPARPVKVIVPYGAGGGLDLIARAIGERLARELRQPVVVENRTGANGVIATEAVAKSAADGSTILVGVPATIAVNPALYKLAFDPQKDLQPVAEVAVAHFVLVTAANSGIASLQQFVEQARAQPGRFSFASYGNGSAPHLAGQMLRNIAGVDLVHVPYKGSNAAMPDLLAGRVSVMFDVVANVQPHVQAGTLRVLGAAGSSVPPQFSQAPLVSSVLPGLALDGWVGIFAPGGTTAAAVQQLHGGIRAALADAALARRLADAGFEVKVTGPAELQETVRRDTAMYRKLVQAAGLRME